jgi:hypothetical protein
MGKLTLTPPSGASLSFDKNEVMVGREPSSDLVVPDGSVSRRHAMLLRRGSGWAVVDQGSANGTFLDSHRVADAALRSGQDLRFGAVAFRVEIEDGEEEMASTFGRESGATVVQPLPVATPPPAPPPAPRPVAAPPPPPPPPPAAAARFPTRPMASVAAPAAAAPAPPKKGRGLLFWIGLGCGGCLTMMVGCLALVGGGAYSLVRGPIVAVESHVESVGRGDVAAAYAQLSSGLRERMTQDEFTALVAEHPAFRDNAEVKLLPPAGSVQRHDDRASVAGLLVGKGGAQETLQCTLVVEDGAWKIDSIDVEPR